MVAVHFRAPHHMVMNPDRVEAHLFSRLGRVDDIFDARQRAGVRHSHAEGNLIHVSLLFLFGDFDLMVLQVAIVPVDDVGRDIVEVIIVDAVVGGFLIQN